MNQQELLYGYSSVAIAVTLFIAIIVFNEIVFRVGRFVQARTDSEVKALTWVATPRCGSRPTD